MPSDRQAFYERAWQAQPPPGESDRDNLVKALHRKHLAQDKKLKVLVSSDQYYQYLAFLL